MTRLTYAVLLARAVPVKIVADGGDLEHGVLARCEAQVAGEHELASGAAGASADRRDDDRRGARQTDEDVEPSVHPGRTGRETVAGVALDVVVGQVEIGVGAVEDNDVEVRVLLDQVDELGELRDGRRGDRVDRRVVERHAAVAGAPAVDAQVRPGPGPRRDRWPLVKRSSRWCCRAPRRGRDDDALDLRHVAVGGRRGLVRGASALAGVQVRRVPVPPVVRRGDRLERAVAFGRFVQEPCERGDVHHSSPRPGAARDLLQQPAVAVGIAERCEGAVRAAVGVGAGLASLGSEAAPVPDLADVDAASDQLVPGGVHVIDDQVQAVHRAGRQRGRALPELDRGGRARWGELQDAEVLVDRRSRRQDAIRGARRRPWHDRRRRPATPWPRSASGRPWILYCSCGLPGSGCRQIDRRSRRSRP